MKKQKEQRFRALLLALTLIASMWGGGRACADTYYLISSRNNWSDNTNDPFTAVSGSDNTYSLTFTATSTGQFHFNIKGVDSYGNAYNNII